MTDWKDILLAASVVWNAVGGAGAVYFFVDRRGQKKVVDEERAIEIRKALADAFNGTLAYYETRLTGPRNPEKEFELAAGWDKVSALVEPWDPVLAGRLGKKADYWRQGATWSDEQIHEFGIALDEVNSKVKTLPVRR